MAEGDDVVSAEEKKNEEQQQCTVRKIITVEVRCGK